VKVQTPTKGTIPDNTLLTSPTPKGETPKSGKKPVNRFQRVDSSLADTLPSSFRDNSYGAKKGDGWAKKAAEDFSAVQGKKFRSQKTKKKKGNYKGGAIDSGVNSISFE